MRIKARRLILFLIILIFSLFSCTSEIAENNGGDLEYIIQTQVESIEEETEEDNEKEEQLRLLLEQEAAEQRRIEWEEAEHHARTELVFFPLFEYQEKYPDSEFAEDIENLIEEMQDAFERKKDLPELVRNGDISVIITGRSINEINLEIINNTESWLITDLPLGLYFIAHSENVQNMILTAESMNISHRAAGESFSITVPVACMNIYKDIPDGEDLFELSELEENEPLFELLNILRDNNSVFEVIQAAIWILQDNPTKHYIMEALEFDDGAQAITDEDYEEALRLVERVRG